MEKTIFYQTLFEDFPEGAVFVFDKDLRYVLVGGTIYTSIGINKQTLEGKKLEQIVEKDIYDLLEPHYRQAIKGISSKIEFEWHQRTYYTRFMPVKGYEGTFGLGITEDITEKKIISKKLTQSEERFRTIFKENKLVKLIINPVTGQIIDANDAALNFYGYTLDEMLLKNISEINVLSELEIKKEMLEATLKRKNFFNFKHRLRNREIRDVEVHSTPISSAGTHLLHSTIIDVTQKLKYEKEINKLLTAIEQSPTLISITDTDGKIEYVNKAFEIRTGYLLKDIKGKNHNILQSGLTPQEIYPELWNKIQNGITWQGEFINKDKFNQYYFERATISPIKDNRGNIVNFIAIKEDITEIKQLEQNYFESEERYKKLIDFAPVGMGVSTKGKITYANQKLLNLFEYDDFKEFSSKPILEYIHPKDKQFIIDLGLSIERGKEKFPINFDYTILTKNGNAKKIHQTITKITIKREVHYQGIFLDVSEQEKQHNMHIKLMSDALYMNKKNALIGNITEKFKNIFANYNISLQDKQLILNDFRKIAHNDKTWKRFKEYFHFVHKDFFENLEKFATNLTQNELQHCILIKLNFTTKEIATFFNVKATSIQVSRHRLKKKLKLNPNDNLKLFIQKL